MRSKTIEILKEAKEKKCAVGAFNTSNLEVTQGIIRASHELKKSCIIQTSNSTIDFVGAKTLKKLVESVIKNESNHSNIGFHLDHGKSIDDIMRAIDIVGVDSVMIDASTLSFKENLEITKRAVEYAHLKNISVQAELGRVPYIGREEMEVNWDEVMTNPEEAEKLVKEAGVDALAVGIGNAHAFFRERSEPDWERLEKIKSLIPETPLIMHGASDWGKEKVEKAIKGGISCFNIDTDIRLAFITTICKITNKGHCDINDPRKLMDEVRNAVKEKVKEKIKMFSLES